MRKMYVIPIAVVVLTALVWLSCGRQGPTSFDRLQTNLTQHSSTDSPIAGSIEFCGDQSSAAQEASRAALAKPVVLGGTVFNTDFVSAGVGAMRNIGTGTITLSGVSGTVTKAYLYWHGLTTSTTPVGGTPTVNGNPVTGVHLGFSHTNCWGGGNTQAYRADVTSLVQATGNGSYALAGFSPMNPNGASLVVYFNDGNSTNNRDVVAFEGNDSNIFFPGITGNPLAPVDPTGWNATLSGINYTSGTANMQLHVADGQSFPDAALVVNSTTLVPAGGIFQGTSVPGVNNGPTGNGRLWDIRTFNVTSFLTPGPNTLTLTTGVNSDCLGLIVALVDLPAGAAPKPANSPPVANAGPDQTVECTSPAGAMVTLNGTGSSDPDGDTLTYSWSATGITFDNPASATPKATFPIGSTTVTLTVKDPAGLSSTDTVVITVQDKTPPTITLSGNNPMTLECPTAYTEPGATATDICDPSPVLTISGTVDSHTPGTYTVTYTAKDAHGNTSSTTRTVNVVDTTPPAVSCSVTTSSLWPPNHDLVNVGLSLSATDACDASPTIAVKVYGDEDDEEATGDGNHSPDAKDIGAGSLRLRSERKGDADGRVYLIVVTATDHSGNVGHHCCTVVVPHSQSKAAIASVNAQAAAAKASCGPNGSPSTPFVVGDGAVIGPKQ